MVFLKGTYLSETGHWDSRVADIPVQTEDLNIVIRGQEAFTRAMLAFHQKDEAGLPALIADLESELEREAVKVDNQEKGFAAMGHELDSDTSPVEAGLDSLVSKKKPFIGSEALAQDLPQLAEDDPVAKSMRQVLRSSTPWRPSSRIQYP